MAAWWHRVSGLWVLAGRGDSLPWASAMPAARALGQEGWYQAGWGSPVGFRRVLQFGASMDAIRRFAVSRHT